MSVHELIFCLGDLFQFQEILGVIEANSLRQIADQFEVIRYESLFHPFAQKIAENSSEVFVPRKGKKGSRIRKHAYEPRKQTGVGQSLHLLSHAISLIQVPPTRTELHLPGQSRWKFPSMVATVKLSAGLML